MNVNIYYNGKLIQTVIGMRSESESEVLDRVKKNILIVPSK